MRLEPAVNGEFCALSLQLKQLKYNLYNSYRTFESGYGSNAPIVMRVN